MNIASAQPRCHGAALNFRAKKDVTISPPTFDYTYHLGKFSAWCKHTNLIIDFKYRVIVFRACHFHPMSFMPLEKSNDHWFLKLISIWMHITSWPSSRWLFEIAIESLYTPSYAIAFCAIATHSLDVYRACLINSVKYPFRCFENESWRRLAGPS